MISNPRGEFTGSVKVEDTGPSPPILPGADRPVLPPASPQHIRPRLPAALQVPRYKASPAASASAQSADPRTADTGSGGGGSGRSGCNDFCSQQTSCQAPNL